MIIKVERSGGFAGLATEKELNVNILPPDIANLIKRITQSKKNSTKNQIPMGAGDHFNYKITIKDGDKNHVIECNQYNIDKNLRTLIEYVEKGLKNN